LKVLGAKVENAIYYKFKELDGTLSQHVKNTLKLYLDAQVNQPKTQVNHNISKDEYQSIHNEKDTFKQHKKHGGK
jgi:hypothetical protein